jgi:hypothetical protein
MSVTDSSAINSLSQTEINKLESFPDQLTNNSQPLLPRSAWISQVTYLRVLFRVKKRLDQIEAQGIPR